MQTTPAVSSAGLSPAASSYSYNRLTTYERRDLAISYTDGANNVKLSLSQEVLTDTVIYTESGTPAIVPQADTAAQSAADATGESAAALIEKAIARYEELIAERVSYLLRSIVENQRTQNGNAAVSGIRSPHTFYTEDTTVINSSLTIEADVADAGFFSAEQTAGRIVDFALSFYDGGDRTAYAAKIKAAVMKGFEQALGAMGGALPQISYDTINLATDAIDQWAAAGVDMTM